ncbi:MAG TPA: wax ester/triacylglycerol synthase domain-containing protein [Sporichthya sp.]|nr:wax ester/triacylglycerol synthase domain-containing protein [Sporichthya sp.]
MTESGSPAVPRTWGGGPGEALTAFETLMWRVEEDSTIRSTCVVVLMLDGTPKWDDFVAAHDRLLGRAPRLTHRVVKPPGALAPPRWSPDPHFDLDFHLRRVRLPDPADEGALLKALEQTAMSGFERARPPWLGLLYEGFPDGRSAYALKFHHSLSDGKAIVALLQLLTDSEIDTAAAPQREPVDVLPGARPLSPLDVLRVDIEDTVAAVPGVLGATGRAAWRGLRDPVGGASAAVRYGQSLRRVLAPAKAPPSALLARRSSNWRFAALDIDFSALRAAGRSVGCSVNDAYLAGLLGGYRRYHEAMESPIEVLPLTIPVAVPRPSETVGGNAFAPARLAGPVGVADPAERMRILRERSVAARAEPALNHVDVLAPLAARLPGMLIGQVGPRLTVGSDLQASNVPGPTGPQYLGGVSVERFYGFPPLPGCPAMITLVTHGQIGCVGVSFDAAAVTAPETFLLALCDGLDEVIALAGPDVPRTIRVG